MDASPYKDASVALRASQVAGNLDASEYALKSLEDATTSGDAPTTCNVLQLLRKQYAQKNRKNWPPDMVRRLWDHALNALRECTLPEVHKRTMHQPQEDTSVWL